MAGMVAGTVERRNGGDVAASLVNGTGRPVYDGPLDEDRIREFAYDYDGPEDPRYPGCAPVAMDAEDFENYDGGVAYWSRESGVALICRDGGADHEVPIGLLARLTTRIEQERGSPICCSVGLRLIEVDEDGATVQGLNPDQSLYLHPMQWQPSGNRTVVGREPLPDVVVEVDHTTDVRRHKLDVYREWGAPEVWVETPDAPTPSRPRNVVPGLTIYVLEDDEYCEKTESVALPTWSAGAIHLALNEPRPSATTIEDLVRVGRVLGDQEGTGPMDDAQIAGYMRRSHDVGERSGLARGHVKGKAEGRAEGRAEGIRIGFAQAVAGMLRGDGVVVSEDFQQRLAATTIAPALFLDAARHCSTEAEFWARLDKLAEK